MKRMSRPRNLRALWGFLGALLLISTAGAQQRDEYGEVNQTVARISYIAGDVSFLRGDDPDNWQPADRNVPMTLGDRVYTGGRSRIELQVHGGDVIRLGARTDLGALNLTEDTKQFSVHAGVSSFQVRHLSDYETFEVDTPNASVSFERPGDYRVDVDSNGNTRVAVRSGSATVAAGGGQVPVEAGEGIQVDGIDAPRYDIVRIAGPDGWDQWVEQRASRVARARSYQYLSADIVGGDDLDEYGRWQQIPQYGWAWSPSSVDADWVPYRAGHWIWQDPWGWSWVSAEPWGWAPYHYGRWIFASSRWCWVPIGPSVRTVAYSPALVAFVGGGPGFSLSISSGGGGFVGWFPLGPRDPFTPWWGSRTVRTTTVANVAFVNRTYVTVVNRNTFVSGGVVTGAVVRDRSVISQVASAPVLQGPMPVAPTAAALHVAVRTGAAAAQRPPAAIVDRAVVVRAAPPPAPPTFQAKLAVINQNQGAPVAPSVAARISVENRGRPQTVTAVRPAAAPESGRVTLSPRSAEAGAAGRRPEPVTAFRGRPMATAQQPVSAAPVAGPSAPSGPPGREAAPRQRIAPVEPAPQAPQAQPERGRERQVVSTPVPAPERANPPGQRGRQPSEDWRLRAQPTQPPEPGLERRRETGPPPQAQPQPPGVERRREPPTPAPEAIPEGGPQRRREAGPPPQQPPAQQQQPPAQAPGVERRRERPTPVPEPPREAGPERGRQAGPPPQQQQQQPPPPQQPAPERRREGPPPQQPPPPPPQGENRPQVERGRPTPKPEEQKKGKEEQKKEEKEKKPTPTS